MKFVKY